MLLPTVYTAYVDTAVLPTAGEGGQQRRSPKYWAAGAGWLVPVVRSLSTNEFPPADAGGTVVHL